MKIIDLTYLILQGLRRRQSRLIFTILGIAVGIGAILFLVALGTGMQRLLLERITTSASLLTLDVSPPQNDAIEITDEKLDTIAGFEQVEKVSPQAVMPGQVSVGDLVAQGTTRLVRPDFFVLSGTLPQVGRAFEQGDEKPVVVNTTLVELFGKTPEEMQGQTLELEVMPERNEEQSRQQQGPQGRGGDSATSSYALPGPFTVVGVLSQENAPPTVYAPLSEAGNVPIPSYQLAKVKVTDGEYMEPVRERLVEQGFLVSSLSDTVDQANKIFRAVQITLGVFGVIGLIVAAIGLINTMTISLLQRTNEIGIMRAIGATPRDIVKLFLGESVIIGILGGIVGIGLGVGFAEFFNWLLNILARSLGGQPVSLFAYPVWFMGFIIILSALVGFIAGIFPARRAANLNPLSALRYK